MMRTLPSRPVPEMERQQRLFPADEAPWQRDARLDWLVAQVVFSRAPHGPFDYRVPELLRASVQIGSRLLVPLGRGDRLVEGYCIDVRRADQLNQASASRAQDLGQWELPIPVQSPGRRVELDRLKPIRRVNQTQPAISADLIELAKWVAHQYFCPIGAALETIVPPGVRVGSNTRQNLYLALTATQREQIDRWKLTEKQRRVVAVLRQASQPMTARQLAAAAGCTVAPIRALLAKGLIEASSRREENRAHALRTTPVAEDLPLNEYQQRALSTINHAIEEEAFRVMLLYGITDSGKTEVYIRAIQKVIAYGRQAIVLVPEISLTPQTRERFCARFQRVAVLHSNQTAAERAWHWRRIAAGHVQVVIGARSAVFAPVPNLGLIVIDEEHDSSFKQDKTPRYHARDVARYRAQQHEVPLLLGSATPSLESWHGATQGACQLMQLPYRVMQRPLPQVLVVDLRAEMGKRFGRGAISRPLHVAIRQALQDDGQVILLLNRRGFATAVQCPACGHVMYCQQCAIPLTHHRDRGVLVCHYCDDHQPEPEYCPQCGFAGIRFSGLGTQRLESEVRRRFPDAPCLRMDTDAMQRPGSHERALDAFRAGNIKILLGTQMIAKGLDFPNVTLVGVVNADTALHLHDFRAAERTFALVTQVAGRTGRGPKGGRVVVQTFSPDHPAIMAASSHDYPAFAAVELQHRADFGYPPWGRLARLLVRGNDAALARQKADELAEVSRELIDHLELDVRVVGPAPAPISKLRGKHRFHFLLQADSGVPLVELVRRIRANAPASEEAHFVYDVDPLEML